MKANEAPEKIYLEFYRVGDKKYREWVITPKTNNESIQYTRTDAFIEKTEKFLKSYRREMPDKTGYISGIVDDKMIEDFKNYMKGE